MGASWQWVPTTTSSTSTRSQSPAAATPATESAMWAVHDGGLWLDVGSWCHQCCPMYFVPVLHRQFPVVCLSPNSYVVVTWCNISYCVPKTGSLQFHHSPWLVQRREVYHVQLGRLRDLVLWVNVSEHLSLLCVHPLLTSKLYNCLF